MHAEALEWVKAHTAGRRYARVFDVGGRDINGSPRPYVDTDEYVALDLVDGPGVDRVADVTTWRPRPKADLVICCEVLEHVPDPARVVAACLRLLRPGGTLLLTCAGPRRAPHSAADGGALRAGEHYANIDPGQVRGWLPAAHVEHHPARGDVYAVAVKG